MPIFSVSSVWLGSFDYPLGTGLGVQVYRNCKFIKLLFFSSFRSQASPIFDWPSFSEVKSPQPGVEEMRYGRGANACYLWFFIWGGGVWPASLVDCLLN